MYSIHGGNKDEDEDRSKDSLKKPPLLQAQISAFKKACRKIKKHTMCEEQEWIMETSYIKRHRLKDAATGSNKRPAKIGQRR